MRVETVNLGDLLERTRKRKLELGLAETPDGTEAMRNKGARRTPEKRELLRRTEARAKAAGVTPVKSHY